jgi:hypothetical protein
VADTLYANGSSGTKLAIATMKAELGKRLAAKRQRVVVERSLAYGTQVADAVLAWAATDGFASHDNCAFTPPVGPGLWEPTPPAFQPNPLQPCWGQLRPFVLASGNDCAPPPPHPFSTDPNSLLFGEAQEVYTTVNGLTPEQAEIARFWADGAGTGTPPGHWILLTGQLLADQERSLDVAAEAYARVGMAVADAFIECWFVKYQYNLLRPVTFIQDNIDAAWRPLITTPPFPEYTSGHSTQSGAASTVLTDLFGVTAFTDETHSVHNPELGLAPRSFASLDQAAGEAAVSRLYGGIHYRRANEQGLASGQCVGQAIVEQIRFR